MRDMGEKRRHGHGHGHGHGHLVGFGVGGVGHAEHEEKRMEPKKLDMSGMSMDTLPHLTTPLGNITTLDLSNNNLEMAYVVFHGRVPGVYHDWESCWRQVHRFSGNNYKGYATLEEAEAQYANFRARQRRETWRTPFVVMMLAATASLVFYLIVV